MTAAAPGVDSLLGEWTFEPAVAFAALAAVAYVIAAARVRRWPLRRSVTFLAGLVLLVLALESGIDGHATDLLAVHMLQHLLLTMAAAPLLVAGAPLTLALRASRPPWRGALARALRGRTVATATRPVVAWSAFATVLLASHVPAIYDLAVRRPAVHVLLHALYLWAAILFWTPLLATDPLPDRPGPVTVVTYLIAAMVPMTAIAVWLLTAGDVVYPHYESAAPALGVPALSDQRNGATVMWIGGTVTLVVAVAACGWSALAREERRARARELHAGRQRRATGART